MVQQAVVHYGKGFLRLDQKFCGFYPSAGHQSAWIALVECQIIACPEADMKLGKLNWFWKHDEGY